MSTVVVPWRNWYHCIGGTYGSWLPGDARGFRTLHHRRHVEGDYRRPPEPGTHDAELHRAQRALRGAPVVLDAEQRYAACGWMAERLIERGAELVALSVSAMHFHLLARFTPVGASPRESHGMAMPWLSEKRRTAGRAYDVDPVPREVVGIAKKHVSHLFRERGWRLGPGGLWATRCKVQPIADRTHQLQVVKYIQDHAVEGAAIWFMGELK